MNAEDLDAKRILEQARPVAMGTPFNASTAGESLTSDAHQSDTMQDADGNPLRLWIPGFDPFDTPGYYFGGRPILEDLG